MTNRRLAYVLCCALVVTFVTCPALAGRVYVQGLAPNWDQPYDYADAYDPTGPGPDPNPGNAINPWDAWCTPTAAAMMMGHWRDVKGVLLTGDGVAEGNQAAPRPANAINWGAAAGWHDYTADGTAARPGAGAPVPGVGSATDIGWYMNTNNGGDWGLLFRPGVPHVGTYVGNAAQGINNFLTDRGCAVAGGATTTYVNPAVGGIGMPAVLQMIKQEIDANRTVLGHFKWWVNPQGAPGPGQGNGNENGEADFEVTGGFSTYPFWASNPGGGIGDESWSGEEGEEGLGHTVLLVGYDDDVAGNVTHLIAHDNWPVTVRNVRVAAGNAPLNAVTTLVPEPATMSLLLIGAAALIRRKR